MPRNGGGDATDDAPLRALLLDPRMWEDPPADLEDRVLEAVQRPVAVLEAPRARARKRPSWTTRAFAAAAAVVALIAVGSVVLRDDAPPRHELAGTELAPGASGSVRVKELGNGAELKLRVDGLAPAPRGRFYQAWVKGERGRVAVGTFHLRGGGDRPIDLWSGVEIADYPTLTVTLQEEGAGDQSSGRIVLAGKIG